MFRKLLDEGQAGDNAGLLLRGVDKEDLSRGQVLAIPGSITPHTKFKASVYILKKEEGGRHTPFFNGYRPQFYFRTTDVTGVVTLAEGTEMVMPGDNVEFEVSLITSIAMDKELRFAIREGGHTVGAGVVTEIVRVKIMANQSIRISLRAYDHILLDKSTDKIVKTAKSTGAISGPIPLPTKRSIYTVFVHHMLIRNPESNFKQKFINGWLILLIQHQKQ